MLTMDMLPRVIPDFFCETVDEALAEVVRRQASLDPESAITRFDESPYRGYIVYSVSAEAFAAVLDDATLAPSPDELLRPPRYVHR
ncbi:MAG: hypothetical protein F4164_05755 [Gemmatimonadales bacterium]|nr:hypothetical protein [Gemmatimonadales bacterium]MYG48875.1 hypothetical protein [Gemmatimonadales bacterium]MYK02861.1 hypothetical protein [Candidatus Palauibacter ramosifaciens]